MNTMRDRAKENFPTVLLTLLSIVQALALELLWSHVHGSDHLYEQSWSAVLSWIQIFATFLGLVLIWVVYASNAMRFRWVPATSDSVYPFLVGLIEFMLVETLGPDQIGLWLMCMALIFGMMVWVAHTTMRRARRDDDNLTFFRKYRPATLRDFYPQIATVLALLIAGVFLMVSSNNGIPAMLALLGT
ncbi:MAG: hypothetical protein WBN23_07290, partial [Woeseia sp.]